MDTEALMGTKASKAFAPVNLKKEDLEQGASFAKKAYHALICSGFATICFVLDSSGHWFFKEAFPHPSFTEECLYPKFFEEAGVSRKELIQKLIIFAFARHRKQQKGIAFNLDREPFV
jgi:D-alanine-D-alanine ligase